MEYSCQSAYSSSWQVKHTDICKCTAIGEDEVAGLLIPELFC
jgi:hypothetical protein